MASLDAALAENHDEGGPNCLPVETGSRARVSQNCDSGPGQSESRSVLIESEPIGFHLLS